MEDVAGICKLTQVQTRPLLTQDTGKRSFGGGTTLALTALLIGY